MASSYLNNSEISASNSAQRDIQRDLKVVIIGAGVAGLSSALALANAGFENITIYEQQTDLGVVGVGIQCAPNMARILNRLGIWQDVKKDAVEFKNMSIRKALTDEILSEVSMISHKEKWGYPNMVIHRASLTFAFYDELVKKHNDHVKFIFGARVGNVDFENTTVEFVVKGEEQQVNCDIVIACDGIKSRVRELMEGDVISKAVDTGRAAYRLTIKREKMIHDDQLRQLVDGNTVVRWITYQKLILSYPIQDHEIYNIVAVHPNTNFATADEWTVKSSKKALLQDYDEFCPLAKKLLQTVEEQDIVEWNMRVCAKLKSWVKGNVALAGDACHATLPHLAQGAAQAIEDGMALSICLSKIKSRSEINSVLQVYQSIRKDRAELMVERAAASGNELGKRDQDSAEKFKQASKIGENPDKLADSKIQAWIYSYDVVQDAESRFQLEGQKFRL